MRDDAVTPEPSAARATQSRPLSFRLPPEQPFSYHRMLPKAGAPDKIIILLHGMSHCAAAMLRYARPILREMEPQAAVYAVNAPFFADPNQHRLAIKPRAREKSRVWYELPGNRLNAREQIRQPLSVSIRHVHQMIEQAKAAHSLPESQVYLMAFSQGCGPALQTALERPEPLGGVALLCGNAWDPEVFGMKEPNSRPPLFYAMIDEDDTIPRLLYYHTITSLRRLKLPATMHVTPASTHEHKVVEKGILQTVRQRKPGQLRFYLGAIPVDDPRFKPASPNDVRQHKSIIRYADDGYGNLKCSGVDINFRSTSHWVNPAIVDALCLWHYHRLVLPDFGMNPIENVHLPRVSLRMIEHGWAIKPTKLNARRPDPLPNWHNPQEVFNSLAKRTIHHLGHALTRVFSALVYPFHNYLYLLPEPAERLIKKRISPQNKEPKRKLTEQQRERIKSALESLNKS